MSITRTIRTVRHLKAAQVFGQVRNRCRPLWERPERFARSTCPDAAACRWAPQVSFLAPGAQANSTNRLVAGRFAFLNQEESLGWPPSDWQASGLPKLWQYNLHYFEWLWALDYGSVRKIVLDWIVQHPLQRGHVGWEPYPASLRLMNWCGVCFGKYRAETEADQDFLRVLWRSVYLQAEWLRRHIETHLLGNHLFENGAALAFVGSCFAGDAGQTWLKRGLEILAREIPEQILPDGMHFERSPMYHSRLAYLLRLLADTGSGTLMDLVEQPLSQMRRALSRVCHPDGQIALFNDSAFSIYNVPGELLGAPSDPEFGAWALPAAGYYGWRGNDGAYLICDAGPIGPDYIPGHSHGDIFSFELSIKGCRIVVDSGVFDYVPGEMRRYCRSTRAHNTVEIDALDQCEFWGAFRVARRGYPRDVQWSPAPDGFRLSAWHDGYRRLPGAPTHYRSISWGPSNRLAVTDRVRAQRSVAAVSRLHLHPGCYIKSMGERDALVEHSEGSFRIAFTGAGRLTREDSYYCPEFGRRESNAALAFTFEGKDNETGFTVVSV